MGGCARAAGSALNREVFFLTAQSHAAPGQFFVLAVTLTELPGDLRPGQFDTQVKRVAAILLQLEMRPQRKRIGRTVHAVAVVYVQALLADLDTEAGVLHGARHRGDFFTVVRKRPAVMQAEQRNGQLARQALPYTRGDHQPACGIDLAYRAAAM